VNIASRCAGFIKKRFNGTLSDNIAEQELFDQFIAAGDSIANRYEQREFSHAVREIMALADRANQYIDEKKPWVMAKEEGKDQELHDVCSMGINLFRVLMGYLRPILPATAEKSEAFLQIEPMNWDSLQQPLTAHAIAKFKPLMTRVEAPQIEAMVNDSKDDLAAQTQAQAEKPSGPLADEPIADTIEFPDFAKV
ncbi:MAG: methionine--tRNA ligase, partial [bacterium]|nr:methionine--tRNA ligase [bacterium]